MATNTLSFSATSQKLPLTHAWPPAAVWFQAELAHMHAIRWANCGTPIRSPVVRKTNLGSCSSGAVPPIRSPLRVSSTLSTTLLLCTLTSPGSRSVLTATSGLLDHTTHISDITHLVFQFFLPEIAVTRRSTYHTVSWTTGHKRRKLRICVMELRLPPKFRLPQLGPASGVSLNAEVPRHAHETWLRSGPALQAPRSRT